MLKDVMKLFGGAVAKLIGLGLIIIGIVMGLFPPHWPGIIIGLIGLFIISFGTVLQRRVR